MKGFLIPNLGIFVLLQNLQQLDKFGGADFKHDNISLKLLPKNIQIRHLWFQIQVFLLFSKTSQLEKFEGADFKYENTFPQSIVQKYPRKEFSGAKYQNRAFLIRNIAIFVFFTKFQNLRYSRVLISNMKILISISSPKIHKSGLFVPNLDLLRFFAKF